MTSRRVRVGLAQLLVIPGEVEANLARAEKAVAEAAEAGCRIVVLPECFDVGWTDARAGALAQPIPGSSSDRIAELARRHGLMIAAGLTEREGDRVYNSAVLVDAAGDILLKHRKINELAFARETYSVGTTLGVVSTPFGTIGLNICADNYVDSLALARAQARMGARLLLSPSSWAVPADHDDDLTPYVEWETPYRELASSESMTVVGVSNVGPVTTGDWTGWRCIGRSLAVAAGGEILAKGDYGVAAEQLIIVDLDVA